MNPNTLTRRELNGLDVVAKDLRDFGLSVGLDFRYDSGLPELMSALQAAGRCEVAQWLTDASIAELDYLFRVLQASALVADLQGLTPEDGTGLPF